jgi:pullulanase
MSFDLLERRKDRFVLWVPGGSSAPQLILGTFKNGKVTELAPKPLSQTVQDLWELSPKDIDLKDGIYHYWFQVDNTKPDDSGKIKVTDPLAYTVDYRMFGKRSDDIQPPGVIKYRDGKLWPCDIDGKEPTPISAKSLPANNHMVIYELPTSWAKPGPGGKQVDRGTFTDVLALFDKDTHGLNFTSINAVKKEAILSDLGINALELLPIADSKFLDEWGYATAHYFSPDADLGTTASLIELINKIPGRLILDTVMAFGRDPYAQIAFKQFHLVAYNPDNPSPFAEPANPDSKASHNQGWRNDYGAKLWRYIQTTETYNPQTGKVTSVHPSWSFHKAHLYRWMLDFGVSGFRLDSINNVANYDFIKSYRDYAWKLHQGAADKFIVIGEELSVPEDLLTSGTLDALWNESFKGRLRSVLLGESNNDNFESTVRKMIDCTQDKFTDGAQAINYVTSHDVEGYRNERLYNFLKNNKVTDIERRAKLAFACLLTAVGIPMIFAGEEFCDEMDLDIKDKQTDPVNYERKNQDWRGRVFDYVARLVDLRKSCPALGVDDTAFIHVDTSRGGKILAWKRGTSNPVVVVANFTDQETPGDQYYVPNWPDRDRNDWREITQNRSVPAKWIGREPLMHWEAKVYTCWKK